MLQLHGAEPKKIVVLSGKGGTGKTSLTAAFAHLASQQPDIRTVLVDGDVDASNLELLLRPTPIKAHEFVGGQVAQIDPTLCAGCGICAEVCRYEAIRADRGIVIDPLACEGCGACATQCREGAIQLVPELAGRWFQSETRYGTLFHADLHAGAENSGKLVSLLRRQAEEYARCEHVALVLVDGPPGIGCPVIAALTGTDLAVIVAEPTRSGVQDMGRVLATVQHFGVPALVCINKADIYPEGCHLIEAACHEQGLPVVAHIPFDTVMIEAMVQGQPLTLYQPDGTLGQILQRAWAQVLTVLTGHPESA